jgi:nitrogen fixation NifU-like protein
MTDDNFEKFLEELQQKIEYEEEATFSKIVIDEYRNPNNFGLMENPSAVGTIRGPCGDTMKISLEIKKGRILKAYFWTDGCGPTIACGSMLTKIIKDKTLQETIEYTSSQLLEALGGLPIEHRHCTVLAINTLHSTIDDYYKNKR